MEMVMSSVFKVPLSPSATMTAYRLMIQRVTKVAQGFDPFINLPYKMQSTLLKHNADLVSLLLINCFFNEKHTWLCFKYVTGHTQERSTKGGGGGAE